METLTLSPEVVAAYKTLLTEPEKHGLTFRPITECFKASETVTANHILFKQFVDYLQRPLPKIMFYLIMIELYGQCNGKDSDGSAGYHLKFKP